MSLTENFHFDMKIRNLLLTAILYFRDIRTQFPLRQVLLEPSFHSGKRITRDYSRDFVFISIYIYRASKRVRKNLDVQDFEVS